jgi:hypothetical protein
VVSDSDEELVSAFDGVIVSEYVICIVWLLLVMDIVIVGVTEEVLVIREWISQLKKCQQSIR